MPATLHLEWELPEGALEEPFRTELVQAVKREVAVRLFADGKIISGYGAGMLGISRWKFIDLLRQRQVPSLYDHMVEALRTRHDSRRTEEACVHWSSRFMDVRTTMIYTHLPNRGGRAVRSPLDRQGKGVGKETGVLGRPAGRPKSGSQLEE